MSKREDEERARTEDLKAMHQVWEQYRMANMFPELRGAAEKSLIEHVVTMVSAHEARLVALEGPLPPPRKSRRKNGGSK